MNDKTQQVLTLIADGSPRAGLEARQALTAGHISPAKYQALLLEALRDPVFVDGKDLVKQAHGRRTFQLGVRFTHEELQLIKLQANEREQTVSEFVRARLL